MNADVNKALFYDIVTSATRAEHERFNIGTYKEKELHIILKRYYEPDTTYHEIPTNGFIADINRDGIITEIETSGFSGLRPKLNAYLPEYKVRLVYPLAEKKYVSWIDPESAEISPRKKSPKKMDIYNVLAEMVYILPYVKNENLEILAPRLEIDEYRILDGWSRDKKRGATKYEKIPTDFYGTLTLVTDDDYICAIPETCRNGFTVPEFMRAAKTASRPSYAIVKVLCERGVIVQDGKVGRAAHYSLVSG